MRGLCLRGAGSAVIISALSCFTASASAQPEAPAEPAPPAAPAPPAEAPDPPAAPEKPPADAPPAEEPPAEQPPAEQPPTQAPPAEEPPKAPGSSAASTGEPPAPAGEAQPAPSQPPGEAAPEAGAKPATEEEAEAAGAAAAEAPVAAPVQPPAKPAPSEPAAKPHSSPTTKSDDADAARWTWAKRLDGAPEADKGPAQEPEKKKKENKLPWRGTALSWGHTVTTTALGVGRDYQSTAHQVYFQSYELALQYHLISDKRYGLRTVLEPGFDLELTDSSQTTKRNELWLSDLPWSIHGRYALAKNEKAGTATWLHGKWFTIFPTSKSSRAAGHLLTISPRAGLVQQLDVFGEDAPFLGSVAFSAFFRYDHLFSEATTPVYDDLDYPVQNLRGATTLTDLLDGSQISPNRYRVSGVVAIQQQLFSNPLELAFGIEYESAQLYGVQPATVDLATGPYEVTAASGARSSRPIAGVAAELTYGLTRELTLNLAYSNHADLDSETPDLFYTPGAVFAGALTLGIDELYLRVAGEETEGEHDLGDGEVARR